MNKDLAKLQKCEDLKDLSNLLGYTPANLAYIIYKIPSEHKYKRIRKKKRNGNYREIYAPTQKLKLLQKRLLSLLNKCTENATNKKAISHGFKNGLSIATNAEIHKKQSYVFNIDLEDFFPSINFGRIRGAFIKNKNFKLKPKVATIIAQIACHNNQLPQGSPCSPFISNLISHKLDKDLLALAIKHNCKYSRYADDITFSTSSKKFPTQIAKKKFLSKSKWVASKELTQTITNNGFRINKQKTRNQYKESRQIVTGLVVNRFVNVPTSNYRLVRSMCNNMFNHGYYHTFFDKNTVQATNQSSKNFLTFFKKENKKPEQKFQSAQHCTSINKLEGILNYTYQIKAFRHRHNKKTKTALKENLTGVHNLYSKLLFFKYFHYMDMPTLICEGKTDRIYISCALNQLHQKYPNLIKIDNQKKIKQFIFLKSKFHKNTIMEIEEGTSGLDKLVSVYKQKTNIFKTEGKSHPVIIILDNDNAGRSTLTKAYNKYKKSKANENEIIHHIVSNLYVIIIPKINDKDTQIEDLFFTEALEKKYNGKSFNKHNNGYETDSEYGKAYFAEKIVLTQQ
ncbi:MAG: retron Ec67 family RNA-directed DNA polymerase/endonuclease, partial [Pseudomonadota bacterium]|nr:retron Ec67 family RNA-directed DNA polymerase/endonuclease [Pseudomonadota bacterium]